MQQDTVAGRYRIQSELGRGGMGIVYQAIEEGRPEPIALKLLISREFSESALRHFEQEFRTLTALSHPHLTEVYDFGRAAVGPEGRSVPFFTMELVEGKTLAEHLRRNGLDFPRLYVLLAQVGQALAYLHVRGLVHQDVKPSNILVARAPDGSDHVKLMDLGLAGRPGEAGEPGRIRGTVAYLAPEVARGGTVDPRTDLYSLGCVVYEAVTGRPPFQGSSPLGIIRAHLQEKPLPPSTLNRSLPPELEELILKLLAKDPGLRYATADRFLEALNRIAGGGLPIKAPEVLRRRVLGGGFVGRERHLARLASGLEDVRRGTGRILLIAGETGVGKSRLLREFLVRCQIEGVDLFLGRSGGSAGGALYDAMARAVATRGPLSPETLARHGPIVETLLGLPSAGARDDGSSPARPATLDERFRLLAALSDVLRDLGRKGPFALALDDLHGADETTCAALRHAARDLSAGGTDGEAPVPMLLIGTYRADEVTRASPLFDVLAEIRETGIADEIFLDPLSPEELAHFLRSLLGAEEVPPGFVARIQEETHGNPLFVEELVALLAEEGHLEPGSGIPPDADVLARVDVPRKIRDLLLRRLSRTAEDPLRVLRAASVLGGALLDPEAISAITGMRWEHVVRQLLELHRSGLAEREEDDWGAPVYRLSHPGLAGLARETMPEDERRTLHARSLSYLERRGVPRRHAAWADLARHAEAAGQPGRAVDAYGRAGELAVAIHAQHEAIESFGRAIDILVRTGGGSTASLCDLYARRGECHLRCGDLGRAEEDFRWMLARAEKDGSSPLKAQAHLRLGTLLSARSEYADAQENLEVADEIASRLGDRELSGEAAIALGVVAGKIGQFDEGVALLDRALGAAREGGRTAIEIEALLAKGALHREQGNYRLALACFEEAQARTGGRAAPEVEVAIDEGAARALEVQGRYREAAEGYAKARDRARERGDAQSVAVLTAALGTLLMRTGNHEAARREVEEALAARRRLGSREGIVLSLQDLSALHRDQGRYDPALEAAEEALRLARRIGKRDLVAISLNLIGGIQLKAGDFEKADSALEEAQRLIRDVRAPRRLAVFLLDLGELRRIQGDAPGARRHLQESAFLSRKLGDRRLESAAMLRLGEAHLGENDYDRSLVSCRKALSLVEGSGLPREESEAKLLRSRIELARPGGDVVRAEVDAREALERFRELREPDAAWQAEHLAGKAALRLGRREEAAARIDRCHRYLEGMRSLLGERWRATFLADPRRRELYEDWDKLRGSLPREAPAVEAEAAGGEFARLKQEAASLRRLLDLNRALISAVETGDLLRRILESALELSAAEYGFLLLDDGTELAARRPAPGDGAPAEAAFAEFGRAVAARVMETGEPLLSAYVDGDERLLAFGSARDPGVRSLLVVPLRVRETVAGALYVHNRTDRGVFGASELEVVSRLADQAGVALHNSRLVARVEEQKQELERINRELERTVQAQRDEIQTVREELISARSSLEMRYRFEDLVGASPSMLRVYHLIERLAPKKLPVLIVGESGTGKELIARALHAKSERTKGPFFTVNCAALTESLLESELFGYRKGAFTGADRDKPGYFELAHGGTLFLDEIGDMGPAMQSKLLRVLQEGELLPVGGRSPVRVDVRILSATNRDLSAMIKQGRFREDLYYRINAARIDVPPLRERREDIPLLVDHFLGVLADDEGQPKRDVEPAALRRLAGLDWPGNVRELQHQLLRASTFAKGSVLTLRDIERYCDLPPASPPARVRSAEHGPVDSLEELERKQILRALEHAGGNRTRAAEILGINRATLFRKLKRFGL